jgi:hypothetical protein
MLPEDSKNIWLKIVELKLAEPRLIKLGQNTPRHPNLII